MQYHEDRLVESKQVKLNDRPVTQETKQLAPVIPEKELKNKALVDLNSKQKGFLVYIHGKILVF